jgi:hypothetical protein
MWDEELLLTAIFIASVAGRRRVRGKRSYNVTDSLINFYMESSSRSLSSAFNLAIDQHKIYIKQTQNRTPSTIRLMETSKDVTIVIPNLNERIENIEQTILSTLHLFKRGVLKGEVILIDGGSEIPSVSELIEISRRINRRVGNLIKVVLSFPPMRPNKNLGILNATKRANGNYTIIIDADLKNISVDLTAQIINPLIYESHDVVIPNHDFSLGRDNRLVGAPILRVFFPEIYSLVKMPFPGILGIKTSILRRIVNDNYHWDWGGELQLVVNGYYCAKGHVSCPHIQLRDLKHRSVTNKINDAYQMFRTGLFLAASFSRIQEDWAGLIRRLVLEFNEETQLLTNFLYRLNIPSLLPSHDPLMIFQDLISHEAEHTFHWLIAVYKRTQRKEFMLVACMVAKPLLEIVYGIRIDFIIEELTEVETEEMDLRSISILCDVIICAILSSKKISTSYASTPFCLGLLSDGQTDFSYDLLKYLRYFPEGFDLTKLSNEKLHNLLSIYNSPSYSGALERTEETLKMMT